MKRILLAVVVTSLLSGCSHPVPSKYVGAKLNLTGKTKSEAIIALGMPTRSSPLDNYTDVYQWDSNNGNTGNAVAHTDSKTLAVGESNADGWGERSGMDVANTDRDTQSASNVDTHVCAITATVTTATGYISASNFTGTVDDKCYAHFESVLALDPKALAAKGDAEEHNNNAAIGRGVAGLAALSALLIGAAHAN